MNAKQALPLCDLSKIVARKVAKEVMNMPNRFDRGRAIAAALFPDDGHYLIEISIDPAPLLWLTVGTVEVFHDVRERFAEMESLGETRKVESIAGTFLPQRSWFIPDPRKIANDAALAVAPIDAIRTGDASDATGDEFEQR